MTDHTKNRVINNIPKIARILFALTIIAFGLEHFVFNDLLAALAPTTIHTGRSILVYAIGLSLVTIGISMIMKKKANVAAIGFICLIVICLVSLHIPKIVVNPYNGGAWTVTAEILAMGSIALILLGTFSKDLIASDMAIKTCIRIGSIVFALTLILFGIQHFIYANYVATLIPAWIPVPLFWTYFFAVAFIVTAVSTILKIKTILTTTLLAAMFFLWVIVLHLPRVLAAPSVEPEWTSMFVALLFGAGALIAGNAEENSNDISL